MRLMVMLAGVQQSTAADHLTALLSRGQRTTSVSRPQPKDDTRSGVLLMAMRQMQTRMSGGMGSGLQIGMQPVRKRASGSRAWWRMCRR